MKSTARSKIIRRMAAFLTWPALCVECLLLFSGCAVGPNYKRPAVDSPTVFRNAPTAAATNSIADLPWWDIYQDPTLKSLILTALTNNYDVRIAATRVEQARAISARARSQFLPSVTYEGAIGQGRNEFLGIPTPNGGRTSRRGFGDVEHNLGV